MSVGVAGDKKASCWSFYESSAHTLIISQNNLPIVVGAEFSP